MKKIEDLVGIKFGRLTVLNYNGKNKSGNSMWICQCECGNITKPIVGSSLKSGKTQSCGCYEKENLTKIQKELKKYNKFDIIGDITKVYFNNSDDYFICDTDIFQRKYINEICWLKNDRGYVIGRNKDGKKILFHRFILNPEKDKVIDHINGNTLDNRRINLRIVEQFKNVWNSKIRKNNKSGKSGVYYYNKKWIASITVCGKRISLGEFNNIREAILKREYAENLYHKDDSVSTLRKNNYEPVSLDEIMKGVER